MKFRLESDTQTMYQNALTSLYSCAIRTESGTYGDATTLNLVLIGRRFYAVVKVLHADADSGLKDGEFVGYWYEYTNEDVTQEIQTILGKNFADQTNKEERIARLLEILQDKKFQNLLNRKWVNNVGLQVFPGPFDIEIELTK